jgi:YbgC/YbaW family acyl-CoA thioester hydrolase
MNMESPSPPEIPLGRAKFESLLRVRPDDLDLNRHVHASRYFDYVLAARYEQMERDYQMGMEEFIKLGLGWYTRVSHIEYKRPLFLGEWFTVRTWVEEIGRENVRVEFEILKKTTGKLSADGHCVYTLVNLSSGRAEAIPEWIARKYAV